VTRKSCPPPIKGKGSGKGEQAKSEKFLGEKRAKYREKSEKREKRVKKSQRAVPEHAGAGEKWQQGAKKAVCNNSE